MGALYGMMQARLGARHGARIDPAQWHRLVGATSFEQFLSRARETPLAIWLEGVDPAGDPHHLEGALREAFRRHVVETAAWVPKAWQPAVLWVDTLLDLAVVLYQQEHGQEGYGWLNGFNSLDSLELPPTGENPLAWWLARWQLLWPKETKARTQLNELIRLVQATGEQLARLEETQTTSLLGQTLQEGLELRFRRYAMQPAALFVHLLLSVMELNRLRGELVRRRLFAVEEPSA